MIADSRQAKRLNQTQSRRNTRRQKKRDRERLLQAFGRLTREERQALAIIARDKEDPRIVRVNTSYPQGRLVGRPDPSILTSVQSARLSKAENYRTYWGRSLDLVRIEMAIRNAHTGMMRTMTDLGRETLTLDGHATSVLGKRINRVAALPWSLETASGAGVDKEIAEECRREVEIQLKMLPGFKNAIRELSWGTYDGRALLEIEWLFDKSMAWPWRVKRLHWIHPRRIGFGSQRQLQIIDSNREYSDFVDAGLQVDSVPYKYVRFTPRLFSDYQEREGLLPRILYWSFFGRFGTRERLILLEIFGKPWRIGYLDDSEQAYNDDDREDAFEQLDALGGTNTAILPRGWKADVPSPAQNAGQVHLETIDHAQLIISKLVLGSTSTTDAQSSGLGSNMADVHKSEEDLIVEADGEGLADAIEDSLTDAIVMANLGPLQVINAPKFKIAPEERADPEKELGNIDRAVKVGIPVALEEARERVGFREINPGEPYLQVVQRPADMGAPQPPAQPEIVWPSGSKVPLPGQLQALPDTGLDDLETDPTTPPGAPPTGTPPALPGAPPAPPGPEPPDEAQLTERRALADAMNVHGKRYCEHGRANRCDLCGVERTRGLDDAGEFIVEWRAIGDRPMAEPKMPQPTAPSGLMSFRAQPARLLASKLAKRTKFEPSGTMLSQRLNAEGKSQCPHGKRRKCVDCGIVKSRQGAPWRVLLGAEEADDK